MDRPGNSKKVKHLYVTLMVLEISFLTLFRLGGYQIDTSLPFSLYLRHGFRSESEDVEANRVKRYYFVNSVRW